MSEIRGTGFAAVRGHTRSDAPEMPHWVTVRVIALCFFAILAEGYDVGIYGAVLPALVDERAWGLTPTQFGVLGSYALIGMLVGAVLVGALSDVSGRKKTLIACIGVFSITMAWASLARTPAEFGWCRFIGGLGLGGVIPTASALTIEYSPVRRRSFNYALMYSGYALGGVLIALLSLWFVQESGWRALFRIGAFPLLAIPVMVWGLPESITFLRSRGRTREADELAARLGIVVLDQDSRASVSRAPRLIERIGSLFGPFSIRATLLFWIAFFMGLLLIYGLNTWLPQMMRSAGYPLGSSLALLLALNLAAAIGSLVSGAAADRWGSRRVIGISYLIAACSIALLATRPGTLFTYALVGMAGVGSISTTLVMNAYVAKYFPPGVRATALGLALGFGRLGAIAGPLLGGVLVSHHVSVASCFHVFAAAGVIAALAVFLIRDRA
ncbi:aromatic acid/H+ symport family MFS transporter [Burkholderia sp. IDO3]|uniref:MFS transporter n=1 Tax=Burkholderia sp. IDO3 TaxID=1705310 RepID=UPI001F087DE0|nr:aromatic acid/H+ symport family MFS transporter [Burkholderia sp. IDO3]